MHSPSFLVEGFALVSKVRCKIREDGIDQSSASSQLFGKKMIEWCIAKQQ